MIITVLAALIAGVAAGYLVNYLSDTLTHNRKLEAPVCQLCSSRMGWGRYFLFHPCSTCGADRTRRARWVMVIYPILFLWMSVFPPHRLGVWLGGLLLTYLGVVFVIDMEHRVILNEVSIVGVILGALLGWMMHDWQATLLGGAAGFLIMLVLYYLGIFYTWVLGKIRKQQIDETALGFGDVNLSAVLGLLLGWPGITLGLLSGILLGGLASLIFIVVSRMRGGYQLFTALPYAPFLITGAALLLLRP